MKINIFRYSLIFLLVINFSTIAQVSKNNEYNWNCGTPVLTDSLTKIALENTKLYKPGVYKLMLKNTSNNNFHKIQVDTIGTIRLFFTYDFVTKTYDTVYAKLLRKGTRVQVWADTVELSNNHVSQGVADTLLNSLENKTSSTSRDSTKGIVKLDEQYFGNPPNKDGDNLTDFLLYDIKDGWNGSTVTTLTAGYFDPDDQKNIKDSNKRDLLYIDTYPSIYNAGSRNATRPLATLAHEYQHLIHYNYDKKELTFVNEGLSEIASVVCGYSLRSPSRYFNNTNIPLFDWKNKSTSVLDDYSRAALFTLYYDEQLGDSVLKKVVQDTLVGKNGLDNAFSNWGSSFDDVFQQFTIANYFNNKTSNSKYGYTYSVNIPPTDLYNFNNPNIISDNNKVYNYAADYIKFTSENSTDSLTVAINSSNNIKLFAIEYMLGTPTISIKNINSSLKFNNFGTNIDSLVFIVANIDTGQSTYSIRSSGTNNKTFWTFTGGPGKLGNFIADTNGVFYAIVQDPATRGIYRSKDNGSNWGYYSLTQAQNVRPWDLAVTSNNKVFVATDNGVYVSNDTGKTWIQHQIEPTNISVYYISAYASDILFAGLSSPLTFGIYRSLDTGVTWEAKNGSISTSNSRIVGLFTEEFTSVLVLIERISLGETELYRSSDMGASWNKVKTFNFTSTWSFNKDISRNIIYLAANFYGVYSSSNNGISWTETGIGNNVRTNSIGIAPNSQLFITTDFDGVYSSLDSSNSWFQLNNGLSDFDMSGIGINKYGAIVAGTATTTFRNWNLVTEINLNTNTIPKSFSLSQNYPNPFNPSTKISYQLSAFSKVSLKVYDILGREIVTLVNKEQPVGNYKVNFDAGKLSSGVYFYRIIAGDFIKVKKMVLLK